MKILALDLGKYKTVGCAYESGSGAHQFQRTFTAPAALERLVQEVKPDRVVIEVCSIAGWVCDLLWQVGIEVQVANTSDDAWRWRNVKQKDDRRDALKAARLSAVNECFEGCLFKTTDAYAGKRDIKRIFLSFHEWISQVKRGIHFYEKFNGAPD